MGLPRRRRFKEKLYIRVRRKLNTPHYIILYYFVFLAYYTIVAVAVPELEQEYSCLQAHHNNCMATK